MAILLNTSLTRSASQYSTTRSKKLPRPSEPSAPTGVSSPKDRGWNRTRTLYRRVRRRGTWPAFDQLYQRYEARLFGFLLRTLQDRPEDAEDVLHDAFLNALKSPEVRLEQGSFRSWLFRIAQEPLPQPPSLRGAGGPRRGGPATSPPEVTGAPRACWCGASSSEALDGAVAPATTRAVRALPPAAPRASATRRWPRCCRSHSGPCKSRMHQMVAILREEVKPWTTT